MIIAADHVLILKENVVSRGARVSMVDAFVQLLSSKLKQRRQDMEMATLHATSATTAAVDISPSSPVSSVSHGKGDESEGGNARTRGFAAPTDDMSHGATEPIPVP